jgi:Fe-S cluster biogenesis protein NfuA/nitrite reductase/ring-hydroxylating ferredoxin subunit
MIDTSHNGAPDGPHVERSGGAVDPEALIERVQELTAELETIADPTVRRRAEELVSAIIALYGEGLERIVRTVVEAGPSAAPLRQALVEDGVVASLLLIHDLHPVDLETRVLQALETVLPYMESHGGSVDLLSLEGGVARLKLQGSCRGCPASAATLELAIKQALEEAAPDLMGIEVEGIEAPQRVARAAPPPPTGRAWVAVEGGQDVVAGALTPVTVAGVDLVLARVGGGLLAYRNACAGCGGRLEGGSMDAGLLSCPSCACRYDLPLAGRSLGQDGLQLELVPLLGDDGHGVRVALTV